jgi:hypothetical protein
MAADGSQHEPDERFAVMGSDHDQLSRVAVGHQGICGSTMDELLEHARVGVPGAHTACHGAEDLLMGECVALERCVHESDDRRAMECFLYPEQNGRVTRRIHAHTDDDVTVVGRPVVGDDHCRAMCPRCDERRHLSREQRAYRARAVGSDHQQVGIRRPLLECAMDGRVGELDLDPHPGVGGRDPLRE